MNAHSVNHPLNIWLLNPYHTGSHRAWAEGYAAHSQHRVRLLTMQGYFWKWRMQGGAMALAAKTEALLRDGQRPDLVLATSMVNVPAFLALTRRQIGDIPIVLYMHENQLTYPPRPGSKRDLTYGMIQHLSMLAADLVCFNSRYHMESWFDALPRLLKHFPDYTHLDTVETTREKSHVLPLGCDLKRYDKHKPIAESCEGRKAGLPAPLILWNQRWEYDKDPETMLRALYALADQGLGFCVALAGKNFRVKPEEFENARARLGPRLIHYGYAASEAEYARLLWDADIVLSTAIHEFFGVSIVEAIYCGCLPVLPDRLSYLELIPPDLHERCLYSGFDELVARLAQALDDRHEPPGLRETVARFDWTIQAPIYDELFVKVVG